MLARLSTALTVGLFFRSMHCSVESARLIALEAICVVTAHQIVSFIRVAFASIRAMLITMPIHSVAAPHAVDSHRNETASLHWFASCFGILPGSY